MGSWRNWSVLIVNMRMSHTNVLHSKSYTQNTYIPAFSIFNINKRVILKVDYSLDNRKYPSVSFLQRNSCGHIDIQFSSVAQSCPTLWNPMNRSTPGLPVHHQLPESTQTQVNCIGDAIQPSHPLSSPSPPDLHLSQHQGLFKWVSSLHQVAKDHSQSSIQSSQHKMFLVYK